MIVESLYKYVDYILYKLIIIPALWGLLIFCLLQHGRVKIKSTAQQEEEKRKEREKKLKIYVAARDACFSKRKDGVWDDEALQLTQQLLSSNPDFATLWNYRREILMHLETVKLVWLTAELFFLESCLKVNPKSYGSWHHRGWVSARLPRPDWARELSLCDRCLSLDDRNFHCWDYRRMVVKMSGVPVDKELEFTDRLIGSNFSNYSSWHYRSTLLPLLHPESPEPPSPICEEQLLKEYELVQNAFFTDPNDQSAWFYYRWLLGRGMYVRFPVHETYWLLLSNINMYVISFTQRQSSLNYRIITSNRILCYIWPKGIKSAQYFMFLLYVLLLTGRNESWCRDSATDQELFRSELSVEKTSVLQSELQSCNQLQELEPLNKWCLLTIILLMRALDPLGYEKETLAHFQTLKEVDSMRSAYYSDLCSKFMIENTILKMEYAEVRVFSISDKNLTTLCHLDQLLLVTHINLSSNQLQRLPPQFAMLQCLEVLEADNNSIESLEGVYHLPKLEEILLRNNKISTLADLQPLASCPKLKRLDLRGNPITQTSSIESQLAELLPSVTELLL
uniref:Geranylgeranyl transferase type-2 subunit alpha n=1 Tax=Sphaeramia orbicularis TaxID=375764 RepID=A0A673B7U4_9TELE